MATAATHDPSRQALSDIRAALMKATLDAQLASSATEPPGEYASYADWRAAWVSLIDRIATMERFSLSVAYILMAHNEQIEAGITASAPPLVPASPDPQYRFSDVLVAPLRRPDYFFDKGPE